MAIHKLVLDDVEEDLFTLIAIHCTLEDYRLTYLLNKFLGITLTRRASDLDFQNGELTYSIFEWEDCKQQTNWSLVSNVCKTEDYRQGISDSLFSIQEKTTKNNYLVPEYKTVNYFLKIDNEFNFSKEKYILNSILKIPQVATAYSIESDQLKSKDHLIFS
ncbi:IPExxxVDY family protein [Seonamhaeicola maritimus]|uniref:IPExxxVDY family protein n=1 Tax=Seonamhaeicola maritimus TaxID=2591822 RepID=A0A5C7GIE1_9FLAO|nr:IPExxxVDY family protein [Seonamhaeicola maritimus]TXG37313.1 IPExxxVDY family protein [Seonamhaeicola maritimus]